MSLLAVPVLQRFLYGLSPFDPIAYAQVCGILALATAVATWVPTRRAISVDPQDASRRLVRQALTLPGRASTLRLWGPGGGWVEYDDSGTHRNQPVLDAYPHLTREDSQAAMRYAADALSHEEVVFVGGAPQE